MRGEICKLGGLVSVEFVLGDKFKIWAVRNKSCIIPSPFWSPYLEPPPFYIIIALSHNLLIPL